MNHNRLTTGLAIAAGAFGAGMAESAPDAFAAAPAAHVASVAQTDWTRYGGNPLFPNGVYSAKEAQSDLETSTGQRALELLGFNGTEISAIDKAAGNTTEDTEQHFAFGTCFQNMVSGDFGTDPEGACFRDARYPGGFDAWVVN